MSRKVFFQPSIIAMVLAQYRNVLNERLQARLDEIGEMPEGAERAAALRDFAARRQRFEQRIFRPGVILEPEPDNEFAPAPP